MDFRVLGSLEVVENGEQLRLGGLKQRSLLAILLLHPNQVLSTDRLIDDLWGDQPPETAANVLQVYVSQLRKRLGADRLLHRGKGYELRVAREELDLHRFEDGVEAAQRRLGLDDEHASALLRDALLLWRGPALGEFAFEPWAQRELGRLEELRLAALEERIDADLDRGRHAVLVGELEALVSEHPLRERLRGQLMLALYRAGRQAEALHAYQAARRTLDDEVGLQPSQALRDLERAILAQDPVLEAAAGGGSSFLAGTDERPISLSDGRRAPLLLRRRRTLVAGSVVAVLAGAIILAVLLTRSAGSPAVQVLANSAVRIDGETNEITASIPVGVEPIDAHFVHGVVLVLNKGDETISRIDATSWILLGTIAVGGGISGFTASEDWGWALSYKTHVLARIDPRENSVVEQIPVPGRLGPETGVVYGDDAVWVVNGGSGRRMDTATGRVTRTLELDALNFGKIENGTIYSLQRPDRGAAFDADTGRRIAFVQFDGAVTGSDQDARSIWVLIGSKRELERVDLRSKRIIARVRVGPLPYAIALGKNGTVWVTHRDGWVSKIDSAARKVVARIYLGGHFPTSIELTPTGNPWITVVD
jgi:DNA-binding SARP family transcriptional activator/DNA-binding beta-propeller fold protein YncE